VSWLLCMASSNPCTKDILSLDSIDWVFFRNTSMHNRVDKDGQERLDREVVAI